MAEIMFVHMPTALLLGAFAGWIVSRRVSMHARQMLSLAALALASIAMPFWMLPIMMDRAAAMQGYAAVRGASLALTGAATVICYPVWAPVLRHLWVLEQVAMLVRYAVWYGFSTVALCTAWDADVQRTVAWGLLATSLLIAGVYGLRWWQVRGDKVPRRSRPVDC